jgi:hypothetical protein
VFAGVRTDADAQRLRTILSARSEPVHLDVTNAEQIERVTCCETVLLCNACRIFFSDPGARASVHRRPVDRRPTRVADHWDALCKEALRMHGGRGVVCENSRSREGGPIRNRLSSFKGAKRREQSARLNEVGFSLLPRCPCRC